MSIAKPILLAIIGILAVLLILQWGNYITNSLTDSGYVKYVTADGLNIECKNKIIQNCGVYLSNCKDNNEYHCMTNIREVK